MGGMRFSRRRRMTYGPAAVETVQARKAVNQLGELYGAFVSAARKRVGEALIHIGATTLYFLVFSGPSGLGVGVLL